MSEDAGHLIIARGEKVGLGLLRKDLIPLYHRWFNDPEVQRTTHHPRLIPIETIEADFDSYVRSERNQPFTIYELSERASGDRPIGAANLKDVDFRNRTAELAILIGEADARGRGCGTEATRQILDYAFTVLSLRNVMLTVYANNPAGVRAYEKAGFREFGRRTAAVEVAGQVFDVIYMECLAATFDSPVLRTIMLPPDGER